MNFLLSYLPIFIKISLVVVGLALLFVYNWKRRWLYYYSSKIPGPFSVPILGTIKLVFAGRERMLDALTELVKEYPGTFRVWVGSQLYISISKPEDVEFVLNTCPRKDKVPLYDYIQENIRSVFASQLDDWKLRRKIINPTFNQQVLNSFVDVFVKYSNTLNTELEGHCGEKYMETLPIVWRCTLNSITEYMGDVDPRPLSSKNDTFMDMILRLEKMLIERYCNIFFHLKVFWKLSFERKELQSIVPQMYEHIRKVIGIYNQLKQTPSAIHDEFVSHEFLKDRKFLNQVYSSTKLTAKEKEEESLFMLIAGSETNAMVVSTVLFVMSIHPEIQDKIYEEQCSIFSDDRDAELSDINRMNYLERVIKETMRLCAPAPYIARYVDQNVSLDSCTIPSGSCVLIPIFHMHKDPEYWPDPLKFDPDRFLPEEVEKRPRASYLAFSCGPRNCIGLAYAMMSMKVMLSTIMRRYKVKPGPCKSTEEMKIEFRFIGRAKDGYKVKLEKR